MIALSWRLFRRELRSGELRLLFLALAIAVAAVTAVGFFTERIHLALEREARQLIGGDLVVVADNPLPPEYAAEAVRQGLRVAHTRVFPSMVQADGRMQLADIKAASSTYPLRGQLGVSDAPGAPTRLSASGPEAGSVWLDERLAAALQVRPGDGVTVGASRLRVSGLLTREPDRGINFFSLAPRLLMHLDDLPATGLIQFGARVRYRLLLSGDDAAIASFRHGLLPRLARGERLDDAGNARPEIRSALDRAQRFLGLATVLTVILSAVAVAMTARRYLQRHLDACAVLRCLGMTQGGLLRLHARLFAWLALAAALIGGGAGYLAHHLLVGWLGRLLTVELPPSSGLPLLTGMAVAGVLLFGFAFPPLLQLARVPTLRVLRRELGPVRASRLGGQLLGLGLLGGLIIVVAGDIRLGALAVAGFVAALAVFWALVRGGIVLLGRLRSGTGYGAGYGTGYGAGYCIPGGFHAGWRQGLASLARHGSANAVQGVALAIGMMAMLLLTVIHGELLATWQKSIPADAPNRFVINIQPEQRPAVRAWLAQAGIDAELSPMIRARLLRIGDREISAASYPGDERARRLVEREFNLSWRAAPPPGNTITAGRWFTPAEAGQGLASVEAGLAQTLGIELGDTLTFAIAGEQKTLRVSSLRRLAWDSMRVNFFVLAPPGVLDDAPASDITSFHLPPERADLGQALVGAFPNLTLIDVGAVLEQFRTVIGQVAQAVRFVFVFTLLAGVVVLYAALLSAFDERRHELAVMRALGAHRRQLRGALLVELGAVGALAGLIAALGASALGQAVARQAFDLALPGAPGLILASMAAGSAFVMLAGWLAVRRLLATSPLLALRAAG